jgi:hypothetical protein
VVVHGFRKVAVQNTVTLKSLVTTSVIEEIDFSLPSAGFVSRGVENQVVVGSNSGPAELGPLSVVDLVAY